MLRSFSFDEAYNFTPLQVATCGHILGAQKMDSGHSCKSNVFSVVQSKIVNLVEMTLETFEFLWRQGQTRESEIFLNSIGLCKVFANLTEQTRTRIGCEDGEVRTLKASEVVCKWHARSPWNYKGYHIYKSYKPLISSFADEAATKESAETADV